LGIDSAIWVVNVSKPLVEDNEYKVDLAERHSRWQFKDENAL
jgi:hypothetical protein